jgi:hypothetical protein
VRADLDGFKTTLFTISQSEDLPTTLIQQSKATSISNQAMQVLFKILENNTVEFGVTQGNITSSFDFGLGMYVSG